MRPYQEEYIANINKVNKLSSFPLPEGESFEEYCCQLAQRHIKIDKIIKRNMQLLREELFPKLDCLSCADKQEIEDIQEFAGNLLKNGKEVDLGLFCMIKKAFLSLARQQKNRNNIIKELYWCGLGNFYFCNMLIGLDKEYSQEYQSKMLMYFAEAAAYLKYYDEIEEEETRGYILRSRANMSLGNLYPCSEKINIVKRTLEILLDKDYQKKSPNLPWDKYIYTACRQMVSSIPHNNTEYLTSNEVTMVMEALHYVNNRQQAEAEKKGLKVSEHSKFAEFCVEYQCGIHSLNDLLTKFEGLMDSADPNDYSDENMYGMISLPAFYSQYIQKDPKEFMRRRVYVKNLYEKIYKYLHHFPSTANQNLIFTYLRQLIYTFAENSETDNTDNNRKFTRKYENGESSDKGKKRHKIADSVTYKEFVIKFMIRLTPIIYIHSHVIGKMAKVFAEIIIKEDISFFDDIEKIKNIENLKEKEQYILNYAFECGLLHDMGKMSLVSLYNSTARQWFDMEHEIARLHTVMGYVCLSERNSTKEYADIALGHHSWYDGSKGFPQSYVRLDSQYRQMTDMISLLNWIDCEMKNTRIHESLLTFEQAAENAISLEGKRFSPLLTARLRDKDVTKKLKAAYEEGRIEAYRILYCEEHNDIMQLQDMPQ